MTKEEIDGMTTAELVTELENKFGEEQIADDLVEWFANSDMCDEEMEDWSNEEILDYFSGTDQFDDVVRDWAERYLVDEDLEESVRPSRRLRGRMLTEEVEFIPEEEISVFEIKRMMKRMKDGGKIIMRVEGGWVRCDTWSDYKTWLKNHGSIQSGTDIEESRRPRGRMLKEDYKFIPEDEISPREVRRMRDGGEIIKRVEGGWIRFDTWTDYETWKRQR